MKKKISFSGQGQKADVGDFWVYRILPNRYADAVGSFVLLDYIPRILHAADEPLKTKGTGSHPHRGIATLTYILNGEGEHFDSRGNIAKVNSGGVQWMKAGNGIIHDEILNVDSQTNDLLTHGFQFWINLPSINKIEPPQYLSIQADEVPIAPLTDQGGWIKIIVGEYENLNSKIPNFSHQFLYHIHLTAGKQFNLSTEEELEYAVFLPTHQAIVNDSPCQAGEFIEFDREKGDIVIVNTLSDEIDIILFGGEKYTEPIIAQGPFVVNSQDEIAQAYRDFHAGKYGTINFD
ncbi:MAG: pirin family protein [Saprospiraceae bacterium]